jgi:hypothetical protein
MPACTNDGGGTHRPKIDWPQAVAGSPKKV